MSVQAIEATAAFLKEVKDHPNYVEFREQQSSKIVLQIKGATMTMEAGSLLIETLKQVDWSPAEFASLQSEVMNSVQLCLNGNVRKVLQDYTALAAYLPTEVWDELLGDRSSQAKLERLLLFAHKLGLSNPTENTYQFICAMFLLATEGQKAMNMQPCMRFETLKMIKKVHKSHASKWPACVFPHLLKLPLTVQDLEGAYPSEFAKVFGSSAPVPSRLGWSDISVMATGTPMRNSSRTSQLASSLQMLGSTSFQSVPSLIQGLANMYGNSFAHTQPAQLPLTMLPANQTRVQAKLDNRLLALPSQPSLQPSVAIMDAAHQLRAPAVSAGFVPALTNAVDPPAALADEPKDEPKKVIEKSVDAATKVVMEAMAAKSAAAAAKAAAAKAAAAKAAAKAAAVPGAKGKKNSKAAKSKAAKEKCKTPASVAKGNLKIEEKKPLPSDAARLKMRPAGCSKCRRKPGCTPSCFK